MKIFIQATDCSISNIIQKNQWQLKLEEDWYKEDIKMIQTNARGINILYCALSGQEYDKISTKEIWDRLEIIHEGTSKVKEMKLQDASFWMSCSTCMEENESIEKCSTGSQRLLET